MNTRAFAESVQQYLRQSGYTQKELAKELNLHHKVLSRKLNGTTNSNLTHTEVQRIIITFINWHVITTRNEVLDLLEVIEVGESFFSAEDWKAPPLSTLTINQARFPSPGGDGPAASPRRHNLPAPTTRLIGREWAVTLLHKLLGRDDVRLVTLVGSGGSGKTRLALHIARELVDIFEHGVWFVSLA
jgi:transcriptional regulator with XRE-family HTH domain